MRTKRVIVELFWVVVFFFENRSYAKSETETEIETAILGKRSMEVFIEMLMLSGKFLKLFQFIKITL